MQMEFDSTEEETALFIEELKSEDPNRRINAVSKIKNICELLGPVRTCEEFIPYVIDIIDECDNDDEFLIKLCDQILVLENHVGGQDNAHLLLGPLEMIASLEENAVRERAIEAMTKIAKDKKANFYSEYFTPMIKRLGVWENYPARVSAAAMVHISYPQLNEELRKDMLHLYSELSADDTPMVRRSAAAALANMAKVLGRDLTVSYLLPIFTALVRDNVDSVKLRAIENVLAIADIIADRENLSILLSAIKNSDPENKSWRVRYGLAEVLCGFTKFDGIDDKTKEEILDFYERLAKDSEAEVRSAVALKLPELTEHLDESQINSRVVPIMLGFGNDTSHHIRLPLSQVVIKVAHHLTPEHIVANILKLCEKLMHDDVLEVRLSIMKEFAGVCKHLSSEQLSAHVVPLFQKFKDEKNWRVRLSFLELLPMLCEQVHVSFYKEYISAALLSFAEDHVCAIREQVLEDILKLHNIYKGNHMQDAMTYILDNLLQHKNYLLRITGLQALLKFQALLPNDKIVAFGEEHAKNLSKDPVANVRMNFAISTGELFKNMQGMSYVETNVIPGLKAMLSDTDEDVVYAATKALETLGAQ